MKAWSQTLDPSSESGIRFLADPHGTFTEALDLAFDGTSIFGNKRSRRYALVVENGKVKEAHVEPDNTGVNGMSPRFLYLGMAGADLVAFVASAVDKVLGGSDLQ